MAAPSSLRYLAAALVALAAALAGISTAVFLRDLPSDPPSIMK